MNTDEPLVIRGPDDVLSGFSEYRKTALTKISDYAFPPGTVYQTPEGLRAEDEDTRCAVDVQGGVYPIRESVFQASYALADGKQESRPPGRCHECGESWPCAEFRAYRGDGDFGHYLDPDRPARIDRDLLAQALHSGARSATMFSSDWYAEADAIIAAYEGIA